MKILLNMMKYDYGNVSQGFSFEYEVFGSVLKKIKDSEVELFDYGEICKKGGTDKMNDLLVEKCKQFKPDLIFTFLFNNEIHLDTLDKIKKYSKASIIWMADDKWRWKSMGKKYCHHFDYVITTDPEAVKRYEGIGYHNVILSQWGIDPEVFRKKKVEKDIDVSFVGRDNPWRRFVVKELRKLGINVKCYGFGWKNGRVTQEKMVDIFNRSKVNLNLSNTVKFNLKYFLGINFVWNKDISFARNIYTVFGPQLHTVISKKRKEDIKARFFEVTGCGGFLLSYDVEYLDRYFEKGKEIVVYNESIEEIYSKIIYYLENGEKRERIALCGYEKTQRKHTYQDRFLSIFGKIGENEPIFKNISFS